MLFKKRSKEELDSSARLSHINVFVLSHCGLTENNGETLARFTPLRYTNTAPPVEEAVIRKFPIILRGDGTPWDLGNLYLIYRFTELAKMDSQNVETIQGIAKHLMMYLRWLEHTRNQDETIHELYFPDAEEFRVTYRYHRYLNSLIRKNPQPISTGFAKVRMQAVTGLYRGILRGGLVHESAIANAPYESRAIGMPIVSSIGLQYIKQFETSNLSIKLPRREASYGRIKDGGNLRPLTDNEQVIILDHLDDYGNRAFQLMCIVALFTGARIQTVCTLRVEHVKNMLKSKPVYNEYLLKVGLGTDVDTKKDVRYRLHFPCKLVELLEGYVDSEEHAERRVKSFYGDSKENYLFLSQNGSAFITSKKEIKDRQEGSFSQRISPKDRVAFTIQNGNAVRNCIQSLIRNIRCKHADFNSFSFHDLRATFGMNFVRDADKSGVRDVRQYLKSRMGHKNFETTQLYLSYDETNGEVKSLVSYLHNHLNRLVNNKNDESKSTVSAAE